MTFVLTGGLRTGLKDIDDDHLELVSAINAIADLERHGDLASVRAALLEFKMDLIEHFHREEAQMRQLHYPEVISHTRHHAEAIATLGGLMRSVDDGSPVAGGVAPACFHELLNLVLHKDMRFINWLADRRASEGTTDPLTSASGRR